LRAFANAVFGTLLAWVWFDTSFSSANGSSMRWSIFVCAAHGGGGLDALDLSLERLAGKILVPLGIKGGLHAAGGCHRPDFVGLPFVVRTLQPVLQNLEQEVEEAAATLGREPVRTFFQILAPTLFPRFSPGRVGLCPRPGGIRLDCFVSGNMPFKTEILLTSSWFVLNNMIIWARRRSRHSADHPFVILALINWLEVWASRFNT